MTSPEGRQINIEIDDFHKSQLKARDALGRQRRSTPLVASPARPPDVRSREDPTTGQSAGSAHTEVDESEAREWGRPRGVR